MRLIDLDKLVDRLKRQLDDDLAFVTSTTRTSGRVGVVNDLNEYVPEHHIVVMRGAVLSHRVVWWAAEMWRS
jgi:hypothetical protein